MKKIINYLVILYGLLLFFSGVFKAMGVFDNFHLFIGGKSLNIPNPTSLTYIVIVNFIGGFSFLYHAISTIRFQNMRLTFVDNPDKSILDSEIEYAEPLSTFDFITGIITFIISFFNVVRTIALLSAFEGNFSEYWDLFIVVALMYIPYCVIPMILVFKNFDLNKKVEMKKRSIRSKKK